MDDKPFLCQALAGGKGKQGIEDGKDRDTDEHAGQSEKASRDDQGEHDPQSSKSNGAADHSRVDDAALKLLQAYNEDEKPDGSDGFYHHDNKGSRKRADISAENRNQCSDRHNDADEQSIGHLENRHADKTKGTDDTGFDKLAGDKIAEGLIQLAADIDGLVTGFPRQKGIHYALDIGNQALFTYEQINGNHNSHEHVKDAGCNADSDVEQVWDGISKESTNFLNNIPPVDGELVEKAAV